ncbi:MAG TPA: phosphoadenylyl-sulfate reductase [Candidatus Micrarchaeia archaeon]|nr:phosphoadenylyl-sulfate reductase [Candidatus Micrarchaeia archaeon]
MLVRGRRPSGRRPPVRVTGIDPSEFMPMPSHPPSLDPAELPRLQEALEGSDAAAVLGWAFGRFPQVTIVASFQAESCVLIDLATRRVPSDRIRVVTLDTGRLPDETHDLIDRIRERYAIAVEVWLPDRAAIEQMVTASGPNLFRRSVELRRRCCEVRKQQPLGRALAGADAWVTGLRRDQSPSRAGTPVIELDAAHGGIAKLAPLVGWTSADVDAYLDRHDVPRHALYARGYTSIGCAPCTRPTTPGEDARAGRWWWERGEPKECGLHPAHPARVAAAAAVAAETAA